MNFESVGQQPGEQEPLVKNVYEAQGLEGPAADFEKIFQSAGDSRKELLAANPEAQDIYEQALEILEGSKEEKTARASEVVYAIRMAAKDGKWASYDDVNFGKIKQELTALGLRVRAEKKYE